VGIDLSDVVVKRPVTLTEYSGKRIAFDAWNILYQFLASIRQPDGTPLKDKEGNITSHLAGILYRTANLVEAGIQPVFVFDGEPHPLKANTLAERGARKREAQAAYESALEAGDLETARTKAQQTSRLTLPMVQQAQQLLEALGIPVVQAPGEGEAQAAWMCQQGLVHAACSQDYDSVLFGAPRLVRHMATGGRRKLPGKQVWVDVAPEEIDLQQSLAALELSRQQLVDVALLVGTDFTCPQGRCP
jgi:flap endonuclease-1